MEKKWWQRPLPDVLAETKAFLAVRALFSRIVLPGFHGMPLWEVLVFFVKGLQHGAIGIRASALSYNFFLALFPGVLFFFTLIPYLPIKDLNDEIMILLQSVMPGDLYSFSASTIHDIIHIKRTRLLFIVLITSLYFSTNGIDSMIQAFNRTYHTLETRKWWQQKLVAIVLTLLVFTSLIFTAGIFIFGNSAINYLITKGVLDKSILNLVYTIIKYIITVGMTYLSFSVLYYYGPAKKTHWKFFSAGSTVATVLFILSSYGFSIYLTYFNSYNKLYGSIGTLIILLVWIYLNSWVLLLGFELNASISSAKKIYDGKGVT